MANLRIFLNGQEVKSLILEETLEYVVGRDEVCQISLHEEAVSRRHLKIYFNGNQWVVEKLSKFGKIFYNGENIQSVSLRESDTFQVPPYSFNFESAARPEVEKTFAAPMDLGPATEHSNETEIVENQENHGPREHDAGDKTQVGYTAVGISSDFLPYVRVLGTNEEEDLLRLEGESWRFGRSSKCEVKFEDNDASRLHFEIKKLADGYYIQDMRSSKGTLLNGKPLTPNEVAPLASGDLIEVGAHKFYFEIRDSQFENRLVEVPKDLLLTPAPPQELSLQNENHISDGAGPIYFPPPEASSYRAPKKKRKNDFIPIVIAIGLIVIFFKLNEQPTEVDQKGQAQQKTDNKNMSSTDPKVIFTQLTKEQQDYVAKTYNLGVNLYTRGKYETALREFEKLHELIPSYQNSKSLEAYCREAIDVAADKMRIEQEQKKQREVQERIEKLVKDCESMAKGGASKANLERCFAPALELDPENAVANSAIRFAEEREQAQRERKNAQEHERDRIRAIEAIYKKAQALEEKGLLFDAIETYEKHISSTGPDPQNLKEKSQRSIAAIKSDIKTKVGRIIAEAESQYSSSNVKGAVLTLNKVFKIEPENGPARDLKEKYTHELFKKMKAIYTDAVLEEGHGNLDVAKQKWQQILDADVPEGEYYNKAKTKMSKYGDL